uniref:Uncharacterized protein n=1 Tax=Picornavirales sp. TaxID=1955153 RepID=A0A514DBH2_9VIRU|nr:MAG: hypothetical protein H4RhizoLitter21108_000001 [Picornavirales sp.]
MSVNDTNVVDEFVKRSLPLGLLRPINSGTRDIICYYYLCEYTRVENPCPLNNQLVATNSLQDKLCPFCQSKRRCVKAEYHINNKLADLLPNSIIFTEIEDHTKSLRTLYFKGYYPGDATLTGKNHFNIRAGYNYPDGRCVEYHQRYGPPQNNYLRTQFSFGHSPCPPIRGNGDAADGQFQECRPERIDTTGPRPRIISRTHCNSKSSSPPL